MRGMLIPVGGQPTPYRENPERKKFELDELQAIVGGYIELMPVINNMFLVVNEEGLIMELPRNEGASAIAGQHICGDTILIPRNSID